MINYSKRQIAIRLIHRAIRIIVADSTISSSPNLYRLWAHRLSRKMLCGGRHLKVPRDCCATNGKLCRLLRANYSVRKLLLCGQVIVNYVAGKFTCGNCDLCFAASCFCCELTPQACQKRATSPSLLELLTEVGHSNASMGWWRRSCTASSWSSMGWRENLGQRLPNR